MLCFLSCVFLLENEDSVETCFIEFALKAQILCVKKWLLNRKKSFDLKSLYSSRQLGFQSVFKRLLNNGAHQLPTQVIITSKLDTTLGNHNVDVRVNSRIKIVRAHFPRINLNISANTLIFPLGSLYSLANSQLSPTLWEFDSLISRRKGSTLWA